MSPRNYIPANDANDDPDPPNEATEVIFYQEDGLPGSFVIDLWADLDNIVPIVSDEITNPVDLEFLAKVNTEAQDEDMDDLEFDGDGDGEDDHDDLLAYLPNDPDDF
jgi:hypothetical protein